MLLSRYQINVEQDVRAALIEDLSSNPLNFYHDTNCLDALLKNDITANLIPDTSVVEAEIITRDNIIVCGSAWATKAFSTVCSNAKLTWYCKDGDAISEQTTLCKIEGKAKEILTAERTALNFLQFLSATATTTNHYVKQLTNSNVKLLDTRKTIPYFRQAQKYAVSCGGGQNHRVGLFDMFLIKENHIQACGSIANAIKKAKQMHPKVKVEVEVETLDELKQAINANADIIMLDNFSTELIRDAVLINQQQCKLEVSGNITVERLQELANVGIDFISTGAITKNVKAIDLSLLIKK